MSNTGKKKCYNGYQFVSFHDSDVASELPWFDAKKKKKKKKKKWFISLH